MLPTYTHIMGAQALPIDIGLRVHYDIWLTYHADAKRIGRVRRVIDWLVASFDPREFPWFRDEFIHPTELAKEYRGHSLPNLFDGIRGSDDFR